MLDNKLLTSCKLHRRVATSALFAHTLIPLFVSIVLLNYIILHRPTFYYVVISDKHKPLQKCIHASVEMGVE